MGDVKSDAQKEDLLFEQIEIGVPLEYAAILAGYSFEEIDLLDDDERIKQKVKLGEARLISKHLENIDQNSNRMPNLSTFMLDRKFGDHFGSKSTNKLEMPKNVNVVLKGRDTGHNNRDSEES